MTIRRGLADGIEAARSGLCSAGTWMTGSQHLAIATESRAAWRCAICDSRAESLSPTSGPSHRPASGFSRPVVEVIHRLTLDHTRLSRSWFDGVMAWLHDGVYVEMAAIVATVTVLDTFAGVVGRPEALGTSRSGMPDLVRPSGLTRRHNWVETVDPTAAGGLVADLYGTEGVATVVEALTLAPRAAAAFWAVAGPAYLKPGGADPGHVTDGSLSLTQVEFLASRLSSLNECFY